MATIASSHETGREFSNPMKPLHLFEFMDLDWLPVSLRNTLREILECGNAQPFRPYYDWAAEIVANEAKGSKAEWIVELGAGTAPLTRRLAKLDVGGAGIVPCDRNPDREAFDELVRQNAEKFDQSENAEQSGKLGKVEPEYNPVDFSERQTWKANTLLVLSATLHHLPDGPRREAIRAMSESASRVLIIEPLRRTWLSAAFVVLSAVPAVLLPILFLRRPGHLRRLFWCWLFPAAPLTFLWDGWISCLRQWSDRRYREEIAAIPGVSGEVSHTLFSQVIHLKAHTDAPAKTP